MSNPVDDFLEYEKTAQFGALLRGAWRGLSSAVKPVVGVSENIAKVSPEAYHYALSLRRGIELGHKAQGAAALAAGGAALAGIGFAAHKISDAIDKRQGFKEMMSLNPDLSERRDQDPRFFNAAYSSLRNVNPTFGRDPLTAGAMMRKMTDDPELAGSVLAASVKEPEARRPGGLGLGIEVPFGPLRFQKSF